MCNKCTAGVEQTSLHMFYHCEYSKPIFMWILRCLLYLCGFKPQSPICFLYFDNVYQNSKQRNICNVFLYIYIITMWRTRKENLRIGNLKYIVLKRLHEYLDFIKHMPTQRFDKQSKDLENIETEYLINL